MKSEKDFNLPEVGVFTVAPDTLKGLPTPATPKRWWQRLYDYFRPPKVSTELDITSLGDGKVLIRVNTKTTRGNRSAK